MNSHVQCPPAAIRLTIATAVVMIIGGTHVSAQSIARFDEAPTCTPCVVNLVPAVTLGPATPAGDPVVLSDSPLVYADDRGRFFVGDRTSQTVLVFSEDGRFEKAFGRSGEGPGEFRAFSGMIDMPGDSVLISDFSLQRLSLFDSALNLVTTSKAEFGFAGDMLRRNNLLIVNPSRAFQRSGGGRSPVQAIDRAGKVVRAYGNADPESPGRPLTTLRALAPASSGDRFWVGHKGEYKIELWTTAGVLERVLTRSLPVFPSTRRSTECGAGWVPPTTLGSIQQIGGQLWVLLHVGDSKWRQGADVLGNEGGCPALRITDRNNFYDTWIEVWDLARGTVLARTEFDQSLIGFVRPGLAAAVQYRGDDVVLQLYKLQIDQPR